MALLATWEVTGDPELARLRELEPLLREVYRRLLALPQERLRDEASELTELRLAMGELQEQLGRLDDALDRLAP